MKLQYEELVKPKRVFKPVDKQKIETVGLWVCNFTLLGAIILGRFLR